MNIAFYISGIITSASIFIALLSFFAMKSLKMSVDEKDKTIVRLVNENSNLIKYKREKENKKRKAKFKSVGWHKTDTPGKKWDVYYEIREIGQSVDEKEIQFEIINVFSENLTDGQSDIDHYKKWFTDTSGGGWLSIDNKNLEWITSTSKTEIRDDKLEELGI